MDRSANGADDHDTEQVQALLAAADKKFSDTLKLLDEYRHGLGQRVRQVADEIVDVDFEESPSAARAQQAVLGASSRAAVEGVAPSTEAMPAVPNPVGSRVVSSASPARFSLRQRRRLHPAGVQRRRRSASPSLGRAQSKATSSGEAQPGKVAALDQNKSDQ
jgi:hypothetical protein